MRGGRLSGVSSYKGCNPIRSGPYTHLTLISSLDVPNTANTRFRPSICEFGGNTNIQSIARLMPRIIGKREESHGGKVGKGKCLRKAVRET